MPRSELSGAFKGGWYDVHSARWGKAVNVIHRIFRGRDEAGMGMLTNVIYSDDAGSIVRSQHSE